MDNLRIHAARYGIPLTDEMLSRFSTYEEMLLDWNQRMNLTAITAHEDVIIKHFLDSVLLLGLELVPQNASVIDIGTGAGFPGIPLKIARPDIRLTLLDSLGKRVQFLMAVSNAMGQRENRCIHARAEDLARLQEHREAYDVVCARAVAAFPGLVEYCLPFVRVGGCFLAMKGGEPEDEVQAAGSAVRVLGGMVSDIHKITLPNGNQRSVIVVKKISQTPPVYPRKGQKITKNPL